MISALLHSDQILEPTTIENFGGEKNTRDMKIRRRVICPEMIDSVNGVDPVDGRFSPYRRPLFALDAIGSRQRRLYNRQRS